jgi:hypothetical protein
MALKELHLRRLVMVRILSLILVAILSTACVSGTPQSGRENLPVPSLVIFVDTPFQVIMTYPTEPRYSENRAFYEWIVNGFRSCKVKIVDAKLFVSYVKGKGIDPIVAYYGGNPNKGIENLSFDRRNISGLLEVSRELGASHVVIARLSSDEITKSPYKPLKEEVNVGNVIFFSLSQKKGECDPKDIITRTIGANFTVYSLNTRSKVMNDEKIAASETEGVFKSRAFLDISIRQKLAEGVLNRILSSWP